jgi:hypothetical protein
LTVTNLNYLTGQRWTVGIYYGGGTNQQIGPFNIPYLGTLPVCVTNSDTFTIVATGERPDYDTPEVHIKDSSPEVTTPDPATPGHTSDPTPPSPPGPVSTNNDTKNIVQAIKEAADKIAKRGDDNTVKIVDGIEDLGDQLGNLLEDIREAVEDIPPGTNGNQFPTNLVTQTDMANWSNNAARGMQGHGAVTNSSVALSSASNQFGGSFLGQYDTAGGYSSTMTNGTGLSTVSTAPAALSFVLAGNTINLDPEAWSPGILGIIKNAWTFILLSLFSLWCGKKMMEVSAAMAITPGGGVPNLELSAAGFGGNLAGVAVALLIPIAVIALVVFVGNAIFGAILGYLGLLPASSTALGLGGNQIALYLLSQSFPISLFLSLLSSRITLQFTAAKVMTLGAGAARWLWTK